MYRQAQTRQKPNKSTESSKEMRRTDQERAIMALRKGLYLDAPEDSQGIGLENAVNFIKAMLQQGCSGRNACKSWSYGVTSLGRSPIFFPG